MPEQTLIEWTATWHPDGRVTRGSTVNFWMGCKKVSPACAHCYMFRDMRRYGRDPDRIQRTSDATFYAALKWKEGRKIFTCSWSDFFIAEADAWRDDAWDVIRRTPQHTWLILTKRTERIAACLPPDWGRGWPHVWLGFTADNQHWFDIRAAQALQLPAALWFISAEPLLGPLDVTRIPCLWGPHRATAYCAHCCNDYNPARCGTINPLEQGLRWVIGGGSSGPQARPTHPDWARGLRDQCQAAGVPFFWKQHGEWIGVDQVDHLLAPGQTWQAAGWPTPPERTFRDGTICVRVGKQRAGRLLDGREWNEQPQIAQAAHA